METTQTTTLRQQLKGIRTGQRVELHGHGTGQSGAWVLLDRNLAGCAVFEPVARAGQVHIDLDRTDVTVTR